VTPENRARMRSVLRESLRHAYLPGSDGVPDSHPHASAVPAASTPLTYAGTPALPLKPGDPEALATRFAQELDALAGVTYRAEGADAHAIAASVADHVASIAARSGNTELVGWSMEDIGVPGLGDALASRGLTFANPDVPFADPERAERLRPLAASAVGLTGAQAAIAESGSLVLVSGPGRSRLASLLTPIHVAILHRTRIVPTLPDLFRVHTDLPALGSNLVIITGPSRTADIEMTLSRGVHGPREIHVILV